MTYLMGEGVQLGVGVESTRGTAVTPQIWIPARTPSGINVIVDKTVIRETRGTGIGSQSSEIVQSRAEGDLEFNVRSTSIGYLLASLMGGVSTVDNTDDSFSHTFTVAAPPQRPALTLGLAQPGLQDYAYNLGVVTSLELRTPVDDLVNATVAFIGKSEAEVSNYTPSFTSDDVIFRSHDLSIKFAATAAGLAAATAVCVKDFSLNIANNSRPNQCLGSQSPSDILSLLTELSGTFVTDYEGDSYHDIYKNGTYQAMQITMTRDDLPQLGTASGKYHSIVITLPKISFEEYAAERPIDDIATESIGFTAHYDTTATAAITILVENEQANYSA